MRDMIRHVVTAILMAGTLAGTVWTFSNGKVTLAGPLELMVSVGGIAVALEFGVILMGLYIGELDVRIKNARRRDEAQEYRATRKELYWWFGGVIALSGVANGYFRWQQFHNPFSTFLGVTAPVLLIVVFTIKLRKLLQDSEEKGRQATNQALVSVVQAASGMMIQAFARIAKGEKDPALLEAARLGLSVVGIYAPVEQQHQLAHVIAQAGGGDAQTVEGSVEERWLSSKDIQADYGIPERTAQDKMRKTPGRKRASGSNAWLVPASAYYRIYGVPAPVRPPEARQMALPDPPVSSIVLASHDGPAAI